ncbi:MAG: family 16 glycoside hydrolase [Candidatus Binatus sp.]|uniref:family 16 glycoside hydrolase n=1 Tax=Candidatus Binatus sp. TaxID=2811406 RepID=UPI003C78FF9E
MKTGNSWLRSVAVVAAGLIMAVLVVSPAAYSKGRKKKAEPTATETQTPTATPTPEVHVWNFDQDKVGEVPTGWSAIEGDWQVIADPSAPSKPNVFGLPAGRMLKSLTSALAYYPIAIETDPTEYSDFTLEAQFQSVGGRFDCSGGLIFRYVDAKNFYLLSAGCPSDYFALSRMTDGTLVGLKQSVVPTDKGVWYRLKVTAQGGHFMCYDDDKMIFDFDDAKIAKGKIGVWAQDDSQAEFDDIKLTVLGSGDSGAPAAASSP